MDPLVIFYDTIRKRRRRDVEFLRCQSIRVAPSILRGPSGCPTVQYWRTGLSLVPQDPYLYALRHQQN